MGGQNIAEYFNWRGRHDNWVVNCPLVCMLKGVLIYRALGASTRLWHRSNGRNIALDGGNSQLLLLEQ